MCGEYAVISTSTGDTEGSQSRGGMGASSSSGRSENRSEIKRALIKPEEIIQDSPRRRSLRPGSRLAAAPLRTGDLLPPSGMGWPGRHQSLPPRCGRRRLMLTGALIRLGIALLAVYVGWTLLNAYALPLFLMCGAVAGWRLWRTAAALPDLDRARSFRPGADRSRQPEAGRPETGENSAAPAVAPVIRSPARWTAPWPSWTA